MHNRSTPQVHVKKATLDAALTGNLINTCLGADLREQVSEVVGLVRPASLIADDVDRGIRRRIVHHLCELGKDRNLDYPVGAAACLLRPDLHYIPPALPPMHSEDVTLSLAKIRTHPNGKGHRASAHCDRGAQNASIASSGQTC